MRMFGYKTNVRTINAQLSDILVDQRYSYLVSY